MLKIMHRAGNAAAALVGVFGLFCAMYALVHIRSWEWAWLYPITGVRGIVFAGFLLGGLIAFTWRCVMRAAVPHSYAGRSHAFRIVMVVWIIGVAWLAEWCYFDDPPTVAIRDHFIGPADEEPIVADAIRRFRADGSLGALKAVLPNVDERSLAIVLARITVTRPSVFKNVSVGKVITETARKYGVSPVLLLDWSYLASIYGKSPSGPVPFCAEMNVQLFRHLVQVHLPSWLIESHFRVAMADGPWLTRVAGERLGTKLRYGAQKASYDIAISPYMNSVMSDTLLVLQEYPQEFPELFGPGAARDPLAESFLALRGQALLKPYDKPYLHKPRDAAYYDQHRNELISFARAAVYRLDGDFSFATKTQALVARYYMDQYAERMGSARWSALSERQQTALLAMLRDVYTPNIGHLSYNLYMSPELNATPIGFLAPEAAENYDSVARTDKTWVPNHPERLWGATALMLHVLSEVWGIATGTPLAGVHPAATIDDSLKVLVRNR